MPRSLDSGTHFPAPFYGDLEPGSWREVSTLDLIIISSDTRRSHLFVPYAAIAFRAFPV